MLLITYLTVIENNLTVFISFYNVFVTLHYKGENNLTGIKNEVTVVEVR